MAILRVRVIQMLGNFALCTNIVAKVEWIDFVKIWHTLKKLYFSDLLLVAKEFALTISLRIFKCLVQNEHCNNS